LSFPAADEERNLGDIAISVETAAAQAKENGLTFDEEVAQLILHGLLHLAHDRQQLLQTQLRPQRGECLSFNKLRRDEVKTICFSDFVDGDQVGMIQRRKRARFTPETGDTIGIGKKMQRQELERDHTIEFVVVGEINFAHPSRSEELLDLI